MNDSRHEIELKVTGDGSHTLFIPSMQENYHSWHGAYTESVYVFIRQGVDMVAAEHPEMNILEVGFGTGLNAILTLNETLEGRVKRIHYTGIEKFPLPQELTEKLNYEEKMPELLRPYFAMLHRAPWNEPAAITPDFTLEKIDSGIQDVSLDRRYHLVLFDAFGPEKQPEMWEEPVFQKIFELLGPGGILVTYCAKGSFKRSLKACGFGVETLPGPPGKREMTRARKPR